MFSWDIHYDKKNKTALIEQRNKFSVGDIVEVFGPKTTVFEYNIEYIKNEENESVTSASHPQEKLWINMPKAVEKGDIIRVKISWQNIHFIVSFFE